MATDWQERCAQARAARDATIPKAWLLKNPPSDDVTNVMSVPYTSGLMTDEELALTELDATELLQRLRKGEIKSYNITLAFCKRAAIAQQVISHKINCLTYMFVDEALQRARELDEYFEKTGKPIGAYHGLPFSIKDHLSIKGKESSTALVGWLDFKPESDAHVVGILREAGAVFYCKTTMPQSGMHLETSSNIYGRTLNPFNRKLSCGGSSGGEGALVAFRGSPIGLAADIGGSIRVPAGNNGLFGAKITSGRVPLTGLVHAVMGNDAIPTVLGPVCRSARDNEYFFKVILAAEPWKKSHMVIPLPWRTSISLPEKLTIGFLWDDGVVRPHPPVTAAMQSLRAKLKALSQFEVVDWEPLDHARGYDLIRKLYYPDGAKTILKAITDSGEPVLPLTQWVTKESHVSERTVPELWKLNVEREVYRRQYLAYFNSRPEVDFLISPVGPGVAARHETARYWGYTAIWNLLDWPACTFPTGETVSAQAHPKDESYRPRQNEFDSYNWSNYEPSEYEGAPISLQLIGRKWDDEKVLKVVERLSVVLGLQDAGTRKSESIGQTVESKL
ncbi:hypothetical protein AYL99_00530 [Fonsecaea erecta]|uniref:amidase n=1 Tax=Fonsecaea erecta TaxID=1367422 RepID=A0A178ZXJ7_9EURO|nr:hypothetical protein AYL99_00530 [Fonsecaea erecta]OAP64558.1 hypothetical protein AYL99_00530 [Fonsecaea erecta]